MQIPLPHFKLKNKVIASYWYFAIICFTSLFKDFNWRLIIYVLGVFLCLLSYVKLVAVTDTNSIFSTNSSLLFIIFLFINIHHEFVFCYLPFFSFACFWTKCWGKRSEFQIFFLVFANSKPLVVETTTRHFARDYSIGEVFVLRTSLDKGWFPPLG